MTDNLAIILSMAYNINNKRVAPIPIWMEHPELCEMELATPEEQAEMEELLKEYKERKEKC